MAKPRTSTKKKVKRSLSKGRVYIKATFNNTLVQITDMNGNVVAWATAGSCGFKGSRKATPFAAQNAVEAVVNTAKEFGLQSVVVFVNGPGPGRDAAVRMFNSLGVLVTEITDVTPVPHNGCRPRKKRRV